MAAEDREELILREAAVYFAENGLSAGTIDLARRIGITQPLLYKYFPTKEALIDRIYERLFPKNWDPSWEALLSDHRVPVRDRLKTFYREYAVSVLTYEHVRLFLFSGLNNSDYNARYYAMLSERVFKRAAQAIRLEYGGPRKRSGGLDLELEFIQSLHAAIYHLAFRRWVHGETFEEGFDALISRKVDFWLDGAERSFRADPRGASPSRRNGKGGRQAGSEDGAAAS